MLIETSQSGSQQVGFSVRLERPIEKSREGELTLVVVPMRIVPDPKGGDKIEPMPSIRGHYGETIQLWVDSTSIEINITSDHFGDFKDGAFLTELWRRARKDQHALDNVYEDLYDLYGPIAQNCVECDGVMICGTDVSSCSGGGGYRGF